MHLLRLDKGKKILGQESDNVKESVFLYDLEVFFLYSVGGKPTINTKKEALFLRGVLSIFEISTLFDLYFSVCSSIECSPVLV